MEYDEEKDFHNHPDNKKSKILQKLSIKGK